MIKRQIGFQMDKFFFGTSDKAINRDQIRYEIQEMQKNGWEVLDAKAVGYDSADGDVIVLVVMVKYEYIQESDLAVKKLNKLSEESSPETPQEKSKEK